MKKIVLFLIVISLSFSAFAQEKEAVKDTTKAVKTQLMMNKFKHNWDLTLFVGTNAFLGEYVFHYKSLDMFTFPDIGVNVQKWLSPVWSIGLGLDFAKFKTLYYRTGGQYNWFTDLENDKPYSKDPNYYFSTGNMIGIYIKTSCDMAYLVNPYNEKRVFHPIAYMGGGFLVPTNKMVYRPVGLVFLAGLNFSFQITPHFLMGIVMEGNFISDNFDGRCPLASYENYEENNLRVDANQKFGINFTYRFGFVKTKNPVTGAEERHPWVPVEQSAVDAGLLKQELAEAKQAAAKAQGELEKANAAVAEAQKQVQDANAVAASAAAVGAATPIAAATPSDREDSLRSQIDKLKLQLMHSQDDLALAREATEKAQAELQAALSTPTETAENKPVAAAVNTQTAIAVNTKTATAEKENTMVYMRDSVGYWQLITFPIDTWTITNRERVNIMAAADMIKATPGTNYVITGYADSQTATPEHNMYLSENRAKTIFKVLVEEYGVPAERLSIDYKGGIANLYFHDVICSRSVMISPVK